MCVVVAHNGFYLVTAAAAAVASALAVAMASRGSVVACYCVACVVEPHTHTNLFSFLWW